MTRRAGRIGFILALAITGLAAAPQALADRAHWADGYVWAYDPTASSYDAGGIYAFNRTDRAIIITKPAGTTGRYLVKFRGLSALLGARSTVHVTAYGGNDTYCAPMSPRLVNDVVEVRCYDASSDAAINDLFTVYVTRNHADLAFAYANRPTATGYAPPGKASWNPSPNGEIKVTKSGAGAYKVNFKGLDTVAGAEGGHVQVNAIDAGKAHCKVVSWGGSPNIVVNVACFNAAGSAVNAKFNVQFFLPSDHLAYAWANDSTSASYTPSGAYSDNPSGGGITATHTAATGNYSMEWTGAGAEVLAGGDVQVTSYGGGSALCNVVGWGGDAVDVFCFTAAGLQTETRYDILYGS